MGERAGRPCSAGSNSEKFARDMGQILCFNTKSIEFYSIVETTVDALLVAAPFGLPDLSLSFSLSPASRGGSARESSFCESDKGILFKIWIASGANCGLVGAWRMAGAEEGERENLYESRGSGIYRKIDESDLDATAYESIVNMSITYYGGK